VSDDLADLLPLFLREAGERLERLGQLVSGDELDQEAARLAKRELHALKGATRMMRLEKLSDLCHQGETVLDPLVPDSGGRLTEILDLISSMMTDLGQPEESDSAAETLTSRTTDRIALGTERQAAVETSEDVRIGADVLASLADRCARSRVLTVAVGGVVERIFDLAQLAERGVSERQPE